MSQELNIVVWRGDAADLTIRIARTRDPISMIMLDETVRIDDAFILFINSLRQPPLVIYFEGRVRLQQLFAECTLRFRDEITIMMRRSAHDAVGSLEMIVAMLRAAPYRLSRFIYHLDLITQGGVFYLDPVGGQGIPGFARSLYNLVSFSNAPFELVIKSDFLSFEYDASESRPIFISMPSVSKSSRFALDVPGLGRVSDQMIRGAFTNPILESFELRDFDNWPVVSALVRPAGAPPLSLRVHAFRNFEFGADQTRLTQRILDFIASASNIRSLAIVDFFGRLDNYQLAVDAILRNPHGLVLDLASRSRFDELTRFRSRRANDPDLAMLVTSDLHDHPEFDPRRLVLIPELAPPRAAPAAPRRPTTARLSGPELDERLDVDSPDGSPIVGDSIARTIVFVGPVSRETMGTAKFMNAKRMEFGEGADGASISQWLRTAAPRLRVVVAPPSVLATWKWIQPDRGVGLERYWILLPHTPDALIIAQSRATRLLFVEGEAYSDDVLAAAFAASREVWFVLPSIGTARRYSQICVAALGSRLRTFVLAANEDAVWDIRDYEFLWQGFEEAITSSMQLTRVGSINCTPHKYAEFASLVASLPRITEIVTDGVETIDTAWRWSGLSPNRRVSLTAHYAADLHDTVARPQFTRIELMDLNITRTTDEWIARPEDYDAPDPDYAALRIAKSLRTIQDWRPYLDKIAYWHPLLQLEDIANRVEISSDAALEFEQNDMLEVAHWRFKSGADISVEAMRRAVINEDIWRLQLYFLVDDEHVRRVAEMISSINNLSEIDVSGSVELTPIVEAAAPNARVIQVAHVGTGDGLLFPVAREGDALHELKLRNYNLDAVRIFEDARRHDPKKCVGEYICDFIANRPSFQTLDVGTCDFRYGDPEHDPMHDPTDRSAAMKSLMNALSTSSEWILDMRGVRAHPEWHKPVITAMVTMRFDVAARCRFDSESMRNAVFANAFGMHYDAPTHRYFFRWSADGIDNVPDEEIVDGKRQRVEPVCEICTEPIMRGQSVGQFRCDRGRPSPGTPFDPATDSYGHVMHAECMHDYIVSAPFRGARRNQCMMCTNLVPSIRCRRLVGLVE